MSWFEKLMPSRIRTDAGNKRGVPEGLWVRCKGCDATLYHAELVRNLDVCPKCGHHERMAGRRRLETFLDQGDREELGASLEPSDPLKFRDSKKYRDRIVAAQKATNEKDALIVMAGHLHGERIVAAAFDFRYMGGSMGAVVGERFVRGVERARAERCPMVCFSASGGARMQEALFSLMQMAKTSAALARLREDRLPFISVLTDPTMGGVSASLAMLGDLNVAEPKALIGFAGPRVIQQTVRETLPEGFQRAEFLVEHGAVDCIIDRREMRDELAALLGLLMQRPALARSAPDDTGDAVQGEGVTDTGVTGTDAGAGADNAPKAPPTDDPNRTDPHDTAGKPGAASSADPNAPLGDRSSPHSASRTAARFKTHDGDAADRGKASLDGEWLPRNS